MTDEESLSDFQSRFCLPIRAAEIASVSRGRMSQLTASGQVETVDGYVRISSLREWMDGRKNGRPKEIHE
jgi:hypothetical protein